MRIAISASQCQGKTTLCNDILKNWPSYVKSPESYRKIVKESNLPVNKQVTKDSQLKILTALYEDCKQFTKFTDKVVYDRCPLDNIVYSLWAFDKQSSDIDGKFMQECTDIVKEAMRFFDIVFFLPITKVAPVKLEERDLREIDEEYVTEIDNIFKAVAYQHSKNNCPFFIKGDAPPIIEIFGSPIERIELLKQYLDNDGNLVAADTSVLDINQLGDIESLIQDQKNQMNFELKEKKIITNIRQDVKSQKNK